MAWFDLVNKKKKLWKFHNENNIFYMRLLNTYFHFR